MLSSVGGSDREFKLVQYAQNASEIAVTEVGMTKDGKEEHFWNIDMPSFDIDVGILTCTRFTQP